MKNIKHQFALKEYLRYMQLNEYTQTALHENVS